MILLPILIPLVGGLALLFFTPTHLKRYCMAVVSLTLLTALATPFLGLGTLSLGYFPLGITLSFRIDLISAIFSWIFALVWLEVTNYSFGYLAGDPHQRRFMAFFLAVLGAMIGVSYADNLVTLYMCFECITLTCFPLIAHEGTAKSIQACKKYIFYSLTGALMGLIAIFYFYSLGLSPSFTAGGIAGLAEAASPGAIQGFFALAVVGFGCKAGLFPLHGWLSTAHPIAPAPASAILSGITTKAGVIAILRILYYVIGPDFIAGSAVQTGLLALTLLTIFMGSMLAYREPIFKTRLAYSTVSQLSYILFALLLCNEVAFWGALLHVVFHALSKTTLFLSAGTVIHETGRHRVDQLEGLGIPLRWTFINFTIAALSLVGVPFFGGFVSKWYIAVGALQHPILGIAGIAIIMLSALLTAGYLLPISVSALLPSEGTEVLELHPPKAMIASGLVIWVILWGIFPSWLLNFFTAITATIF